MAAEKVTVMVLMVDLQCSSCYKKVKKTLCKVPQIRDQVYDEKANTVTIKVVCCSPERVRDKLCSKGGKSIKSIEIKEPEKPKEPERPKEPEKPKAPEKPKEPEKPKDAEKPKEPEKPKASDKPDSSGPPPSEKPKPEPAANPLPPAPTVAAAKGPEPFQVGVPSVFPYLGPTYVAYGEGPYYHGYSMPPPPPSRPCYEGFYGNGYGYGRSYDHSYYGHEENSQGCSIM